MYTFLFVFEKTTLKICILDLVLSCAINMCLCSKSPNNVRDPFVSFIPKAGKFCTPHWAVYS